MAAIKTAAAGENLWTRERLRRITGALATPRLQADVEVPLTEREAQVLRHMAGGLTNKQIAVESKSAMKPSRSTSSTCSARLAFPTERRQPCGRCATDWPEGS